MVQVREQSHIDATGDINLQRWLQQLPLELEDGDADRLLAACHRAQLALKEPGEDSCDWASESDCFVAGLDMTLILAELHVGLDCLLAGILYRAVREKRLRLATVADEFGDEVAQLVSGVVRMAAIGDLSQRVSTRCWGRLTGRRITFARC